MSTRTKAIGISFIIVTILLAVLVDIFDWSTWILAVPVVILEILFFVSAATD
jgi:hypothetical protein